VHVCVPKEPLDFGRRSRDGRFGRADEVENQRNRSGMDLFSRGWRPRCEARAQADAAIRRITKAKIGPRQRALSSRRLALRRSRVLRDIPFVVIDLPTQAYPVL
jgi:hypothetical protein